MPSELNTTIYIEEERLLTDDEILELEKESIQVNFLINNDDYDSIFEKIQKDFEDRFKKKIELRLIKKVVNEYFRLMVFFTELNYETLIPSFFKITNKKTVKTDKNL